MISNIIDFFIVLLILISLVMALASLFKKR